VCAAGEGQSNGKTKATRTSETSDNNSSTRNREIGFEKTCQEVNGTKALRRMGAQWNGTGGREGFR